MSIYGVLPERFMAVSITVMLLVTDVSGAARAGVVALGMLGCMFVDPAIVGSGLAGGLISDSRAQAAKVLRCAGTVACLVTLSGSSAQYGGGSLTRWVPRGAGEAGSLGLVMLFALLGGMILVSADDLRLFYLGLELQSLALYVLAASRRGSAYSTEAGLKFFMLGAFGSGLFLLGASLVYGSLGSTNYDTIGALLRPGTAGVTMPMGSSVGIAVIVASVMFKLAAAPFRMWSPDVIEGSPASSARFIASVSKIAAFGALIRLGYGPAYPLWTSMVGGVAIISALSRVVAALAALGQRRIKRFFAYSGIGHMGFMLIGLTATTLEGLQASMRYLTVYVVGSVCVWAAIVYGGWQYLTDLGGLARRQPALAMVLAIALFSRAGVPPMAGFLAKLTVFFAAMESSSYGLVTLGVLASVVGAFYYLRIIKIRYFEAPRAVSDNPLRFGTAWVLAVCSYLRLLMLWDPSFIMTLVRYSVYSLQATSLVG